jgi:hypothetical protein
MKAETHPRPSPAEARQRSHMRHAASDATQKHLWNGFIVVLVVLLLLGIALGLRARGFV